ncbi:O-glucosyltransferase 1 [Micractinium conductrix]|uniref:O-glucosyltransferase 1 n=1 Tax=Micractinium conductrix TaxID=554055 RepID=A0A2P6VCI6_9CHLO|nr:O-glucosyltransferase 1 [Micractinium conductrix]|eukprot:PSC71797.1 O-glucosyltransferase 1 [Micractinium conductrix]
MGVRQFNGKGAGLGLWFGCGFGAGWGFGGAPLGVAGLSAGGMCGVVAGLGWGAGFGMGTQYINVSPEFTEGKKHRPNIFKQAQYIVNKRAYVVGEAPSYESRLLGIKRQLLPLWMHGQLPEGLDVVIEQEDWPTVLRNRTADCPDPGPLVAPAKQTGNDSHAHALLAPDHSFAGWPEARTLSWAEMLPLLQRAAAHHPWDNRSRLLFFRGAATGDRNLTDPDLSLDYPELLDVQLVNWTQAEQAARFVPLTDHCRHRLLLHMPGNSYAARLKYLMACGSAVVSPDSPFAEFWYHLLRRDENIIVVEPVDSFNRGHHLADAAEELRQDDWLAGRVGAAGAGLAADALAPVRVAAYWRRLLQKYAELQLRNVTERTCSMCAHTREQWEVQRRRDLNLTAEEEPPPGWDAGLPPFAPLLRSGPKGTP